MLAVHTCVGSLFTSLDRSVVSERGARVLPALMPIWAAAGELLLLNAEAEEEICFPAILGNGPEGLAATDRAIADHDDIREAICETRLHDAGSGAWWRAVNATRKATSDHFTGPESSALILSAAGDPLTFAKRWGVVDQIHRGPPVRQGDRPNPQKPGG